MLLAVVVAAWASALAPYTSAQGPTAPRYSLEAAVDYHSATLDVNQATEFRNATGVALDRAVFHVSTASFGAFRLDAVTAQHQPTAASLDGTVLEVPFASLLMPGEPAEIGFRYQLSVPRRPDRFGAGPQALALGNWFPTLAVHRGDWDRHQYTDVGDAFVTEVGDFDVRLSTSIPLTIASTGRVLDENGTNFRLQALGVRDFGISLSPEYVRSETGAGDAVVKAYAFSQERSRLFADSAAKFLAWYGERFGAYPQQTLSVAEVDLPASYGGMEYPGLIFLSSALAAPSPFEGSATDVLIGHEIAHQWFYSLVGSDQVREPWVDEAFAQYLPYHYFRSASPPLFNRLWNGQMSGLGERIQAAGGLPVDTSIYAFPNDGPYYTIVYRQGARFLDELRETMGDAAFDQALAEVVRTFADKIAWPGAVLDTFQRHSPVNLNPLIARYFSYTAFHDPAPASWRLEAPAGAWRGTVYLFFGAEFPISQVEVWLENRRLYTGEQNALTLSLDDVEPGDYALIVRVWDDRGVQFERARRVSVAPE
jgi:hypothetical protein